MLTRLHEDVSDDGEVGGEPCAGVYADDPSDAIARRLSVITGLDVQVARGRDSRRLVTDLAQVEVVRAHAERVA